MKPTKNVVVTGGAGQIAYSLLFRIASGEMFGWDQPIALHILEVPAALEALKGVKMELEDCAFPLLKDIRIGSDPLEIFEGVHYALLVGAKPRGPGMERKELLNDNGAIFVEQGKALNEKADPNVKVLVVGNPCNTNCLIAMSHAPKISPKNFFAMTSLDENRAKAQLALKASVEVTSLSNMTIWGNHSSTQVPDFLNAKINQKPVLDTIKDRSWLEDAFISTIQKRGASIIAARGKSSAASAANAAIDAIKNLLNPTPQGDWFSMGLYAYDNTYGIEKNLIFSFPCRSDGNGDCQIIENIFWDDFLMRKIRLSELELLEERDLICDKLRS